MFIALTQEESHNKNQQTKIPPTVGVGAGPERVDQTKKLLDYKKVTVCVDRLMNLAGGTTWETNLQAVNKE